MTSVSKWIPLLLVVTSEFKLCCNFFFSPSVRNLVRSGRVFLFVCFSRKVAWKLFVFGTSRNNCQPGLFASSVTEKPSSVWQRHLFIVPPGERLTRLGFIYKDIMVYNSPVQYNVQIQKLLYSVFNRSSVKFKFFVFIAPHFIPISFSNTSAVICLPPHQGVSEIDYLKKRGVLHNISVSSHCIFFSYFFFYIGVMIPHSVTACSSTCIVTHCNWC